MSVKSFFNTIRNKLKRLGNDEKKGPVDEPVMPVSVETGAPKKPSKKKSYPKDEPKAGAPEQGVKKKRKRRRRKKKKTPPLDRGVQLPVTELVEAHKNWDVSQYDIPPAEGKVRFHDLNLPSEILHAVSDLGFQYCSPIQAEVLAATLTGRDASGQAQTGTGKTAAFLITLLSRFIHHPIDGKRAYGMPRALILAPTRELVIQIAEEAGLLSKYYPSTIVTIYGGMDYQKQRRQLSDQVVDIVVATPGRLIDFCEHNDVRLDNIETLVIDEADRMLDMGFIPQVRRIVRKTPFKEKRQTLLFSATMTGDVERLSAQWTRDPLMVEVEPEQVEVASVDQIVYLVTRQEKFAVLYNAIIKQDLKRAIIFCNRRDETHRVADHLMRYNISCAVISGEVAQKKRLRTLENFRAGNIRVLVATDVAGRGLHIEGISHVINYSLPHEPENYVHRIGRTGRAGATGTSISFACEADSFYIPAIEEFLGHELSCSQPEEEWLKLPPAPKQSPKSSSRPPRKKSRRRRPRRKRNYSSGKPKSN